MARTMCDATSYPPPVLAVAGYGLPGATRAFPIEPLDDASWAAVVTAARTQRVTGLLGTAVAAGAFPVTAAQKKEARAAYRTQLLRVLALERELARRHRPARSSRRADPRAQGQRGGPVGLCRPRGAVVHGSRPADPSP